MIAVHIDKGVKISRLFLYSKPQSAYSAEYLCLKNVVFIRRLFGAQII